MKFLKKLRQPPEKKGETPEEILKIAQAIGPLIENAARDIFSTYNTALMTQPVTYIVPAVWGVNTKEPLTAEQQEMNAKIAPMVQDAIRQLDLNNLTSAQEFAIGYLIRGFLVSKITFMIEAMRNQNIKLYGCEEKEPSPLTHMEPIGSA